MKLRNPQIAKLHSAATRQAKRSAATRKLSREAQLRQTARRKVRRVLKQTLREIAARAKRANAAVTRACVAARKRVMARTKREREEARRAINARRDAGLNRVQLQCESRRKAVARGKLSATAAALIKADHERALWDEVYGAPNKRKTVRSQERRQESDQEVEANLSPELIPVWRRHKRAIKAGPRRSRTEAFEEWVHDHESDVRAELAELADRETAKAQKSYAREQARWEREQHAAQMDALVREYVKTGMTRNQAKRAAKTKLLGLEDVPF
jgi:hypothetical protein